MTEKQTSVSFAKAARLRAWSRSQSEVGWRRKPGETTGPSCRGRCPAGAGPVSESPCATLHILRVRGGAGRGREAGPLHKASAPGPGSSAAPSDPAAQSARQARQPGGHGDLRADSLLGALHVASSRSCLRCPRNRGGTALLLTSQIILS